MACPYFMWVNIYLAIKAASDSVVHYFNVIIQYEVATGSEGEGLWGGVVS